MCLFYAVDLFVSFTVKILQHSYLCSQFVRLLETDALSRHLSRCQCAHDHLAPQFLMATNTGYTLKNFSRTDNSSGTWGGTHETQNRQGK